ncbi:oligopeptide ABC transporter permease OppC [Faecalibaculum rodentium]|uniref:oligopeptide ABC transporter permease OppC n=1 Tax=Faecalibaculum rodentium TaxID=1702221 RepID=UPI00259CFA21|nr:oligopeptide ABC transporter permease OppC [Faecalibaculum rodentium]
MSEGNNKFQFVKLDEQASEHISAPVYSYWKSVWRTFFKNKLAIFMLAVAVLVIIFSFIQPMFSGYDINAKLNILDTSRRYLSPSAEFWFGTDNVGDSLFDAVWAAAGSSLEISLIVTTINTVIGITVGAIWGYSKKLDAILIEIYNIIANVPFILIVMIMSYILGQGKWQLIFAMTVTGWMGTAYFIRTQVMIIRDREYNLASRCLGTPLIRMVTKNILPYLISVIVTLVSREIPSNISYEVFLSYMDLGLDERVPSLGRLISNYTSFMSAYPHMFWIPVAVLATVTVSLYLVGQFLADASDPKTHM